MVYSKFSSESPSWSEPSDQSSSKLGYSAHRDRQRRRILAAAESLFTKSGIDRISMLEITAASGVQPSTLYQYFKRKEDIVWAITSEVLSGIRDRVQSRVEEQTTGLQKIAAMLEIMSEDLEVSPEKVRFMAQFDVLYARDLPAESLLQSERQLGMESFSEFRHWVTAGIADGSMRPELDPEITLHAVLNAAVGTQRRLGSLGSKVEQEYGPRPNVLFREAMRVILLGLRSEPASTSREGSQTRQTKSRHTARRKRP